MRAEFTGWCKLTKFVANHVFSNINRDMAAPIMDGNDQVEGFFMDCGWGYFGFKSCSAVGKYMAEFMATNTSGGINEPPRRVNVAWALITGRIPKDS